MGGLTLTPCDNIKGLSIMHIDEYHKKIDEIIKKKLPVHEALIEMIQELGHETITDETDEK
jgi:hypothetical protein